MREEDPGFRGSNNMVERKCKEKLKILHERSYFFFSKEDVTHRLSHSRIKLEFVNQYIVISNLNKLTPNLGYN